MKKDVMRVGLIGCGYQGQWLARAIKQIDELTLAACVDPVPDTVKTIQQLSNETIAYSTPESMLDDDAVEVVLIATPHHLLQPYALLAIDAGKHVLAEKPIALNEQQAEELESAVNRQGVTYMAGYSFRYFDQPILAKQLICDGVLGTIQTISAGMVRQGLRSGWPSELATGGGMLGFYGCHMVDRILWFIDDEPKEVFAEVRRHPQSGVDLTSVVQIRFAGGATVSLNLCGEAHGPFDFAHVCGDAGWLYLAVEDFPQYTLTVFSDNIEAYATPQTYRSNLDRNEAILKKMVAELSDFTDAIRNGTPPPISVADGRKVLAILDAIALSDKTGQPVQLSVTA